MEQAVILAAGRGSRLAAGRSNPEEFSKPLLKVAGKPLIQHVLDNCAKAGVEEAIVITGYRSSMVCDAVQHESSIPVRHIYNARWTEPNGLSALAARSAVEGSFFLMMADHLFDPSILTDLRNTDGQADVTLATDARWDMLVDLEDATKVLLDDRDIKAIGKDLRNFNGVDCGLFRCTSVLFKALEVAAAKAPPSLTDGLNELIRFGSLKSLDIGSRWWQDVDTPKTAQAAEVVLARR